MDVMAIGKRLVELSAAGKGLDAIRELYADDIVSVEATEGTPEIPQRMGGIEAITAKSEWWYGAHEIHSVAVDGPYPHGDRFAVIMDIDVTAKEGPMAGQRMQMREVCLYTVRGGKIAHEEFFYSV